MEEYTFRTAFGESLIKLGLLAGGAALCLLALAALAAILFLIFLPASWLLAGF